MRIQLIKFKTRPTKTESRGSTRRSRFVSSSVVISLSQIEIINLLDPPVATSVKFSADVQVKIIKCFAVLFLICILYIHLNTIKKPTRYRVFPR
jgi:hypothetical protein